MIKALLTRRGVFVFFLVYALVFIAIRFLTAPALGVDADLELLFSQNWALGYSDRQPPLYTWLLAALQTLTGPGLQAVLILKYALWGGTVMLYADWARRVLNSEKWGAASALSLLGLYQLGWNVHEGVTHTLVLMLSCAATLWFWQRLAERKSWGDYVGLGLAVGCGFLSKYGYAALLVSLLSASAFRTQYRSVLLDGRLALSLGIGAVLAGPSAFWVFFGEDLSLSRVFANTMQVSHDDSRGDPFSAFWSMVLAMLGFMAPYLLILRFMVPFGKPWSERTTTSGVKLARDIALVSTGLLVIGVLFPGVAGYKERWMHPFMFTIPLYIVAAFRDAEPGKLRLKVAAWTWVVLVGVVMLGRVATNLGGAPLCGSCRLLIPYAPLVQTLRTVGLEKNALVLSNDTFTVANLRSAFPEAMYVSLAVPNFLPQGIEKAENCIMVMKDPQGDVGGQKVTAIWRKMWNGEVRTSTWSITKQGSPKDCLAMIKQRIVND